MKTRIAGLIVVACSMGIASADILRVGAGSFSAIGNAVLAAGEGDIILVDPGTYPGFSIDAKSVSIVASQIGGSFLLQGSVTVANLGVLQVVDLSGARTTGVQGPALRIQNCDGAVSVSDSRFTCVPGGGTQTPGGGCGMFVLGSENVLIANCLLEGSGRGGYQVAGSGALLIDSSVSFFDTQILGGDGPYAWEEWGGVGLSGDITSIAFLANCSVFGGDGSDGFGPGLGGWQHRGGGDAVLFANASGLSMIDTTRAGGAAGTGGYGFGGPGGPGTTGIQWPGSARTLGATRISFDNAMAVLTFEGEPGDVVSYLASDVLERSPGEVGPKLVQGTTWIAAGIIPPSGALVLPHNNLDGPQWTAANLFAQARFHDPVSNLDYFTQVAPSLVLDRGLDDCTIRPVHLGRDVCGSNVPNSSGAPGVLTALGSHCVSLNEVTLTVSQLPPHQFGYFLNSSGLGFVSNPGGAQGNLCLGGGQPIGRHNAPGEIRNSGFSGAFSLVLDLNSLPTPSGATTVMAGQGMAFQAWYRDGSASNFSSAVAIAFH